MPLSTPTPAPAPERQRIIARELRNFVSDLETCFDAFLSGENEQMVFGQEALRFLITMCASDLRSAAALGREKELIASWKENAAGARATLISQGGPQTLNFGGQTESVYLISEDHLKMVFENCPKPYSEPRP